MPIIHRGITVNSQRLATCLALAAATTMLGGCLHSNIPPPLPALFRIDEIRYWWEGDHLIVNVTFTNQHPTHTPGEGALDPRIIVSLSQEKVQQKGDIGRETRTVYGGADNLSVNLNFGTEYGNPWQKRWYRSTITGPMHIPPGTTMSVEVALEPDFVYRTQDDGYYFLRVDMTYWYPNSFKQKFQGEESAIYYTGCFNQVVHEFYGVKKGGADCLIWDCTGERTEYGFELRAARGTYRPNCNATQAIGPDYS